MELFSPILTTEMRQASLSDLTEEDRLVVESARLWLDSFEGKVKLWSVYAQKYGAAEGRVALKAFEKLLIALANGSDRNLTCCPCGCKGVSEDEMLMSALVRHAAMGEQAAALGCAIQFARPDALYTIVEAAQRLGEKTLLRRPARTHFCDRSLGVLKLAVPPASARSSG